MKVTIRKISEITGFSPATISNALNRKRGVNPETAAEIFRVAEETGYLSAVNQKKIKFVMFKANGMITENTPFFSMMLDGFQNECRQSGYEMVVCYIDRRSGEFEKQVREIVNDSSAVVALLGTELQDGDFELFRNAKCPLLAVDYWNEDMSVGAVLINNEDSARMAVSYLVEKGHVRIGYLRGAFRIKSFRARYTGYKMALMKRNIAYEKNNTVTLRADMEGAYKDMLVYLKTNPQLPTAYFADNDMIALGAMKALQEMGIKVPEDVSLIGFDDLPFCEIASPRLTSLRVPKQEMGRLAVRKLIEMITYGDKVKTKTQICAEFMERDSVRDLTKQ